MQTASLRSTLSRTDIARAIGAAFPALDSATLTRATGAAARALVGATDTGAWHGPAEQHGYNDHPRASFRMESRASDARDIGTLRMLARDADSVGASGCAKHCRTLASIFANSASDDAYCMLHAAGVITYDRDVTGFVGPAIGEAYHRPTDMFVGVLARDGASFLFRSPYRFDDRCARAFLFLHDASPALESYMGV